MSYVFHFVCVNSSVTGPKLYHFHLTDHSLNPSPGLQSSNHSLVTTTAGLMMWMCQRRYPPSSEVYEGRHIKKAVHLGNTEGCSTQTVSVSVNVLRGFAWSVTFWIPQTGLSGEHRSGKIYINI